MRIYSMTATFGKLEHETLVLKPGLNVICAGNEWGKSTWCHFLGTMLYGLDTRAKSTRTALAEKERYAPWSGSPMSGRMDLNWQGRDITIERRTTGRTPMGDFLAYETATGLRIPELDSRNCGEKLLGVERSVFLRTGFIRSGDLNVTDDEALRRRLNSLVTTGDENSDADRLAGELKNLKNRIRHNRTGLLPQAEAERAELEEKYRQLQALEARNGQILRKLDSNKDWQMALENHGAALTYAASLEDARKVDQAAGALREAREELEDRERACQTLPDRETALERLRQLYVLQDQLLKIQRQIQELTPEQPLWEVPEPFQHMTPEEAGQKVREDALRMQSRVNYRLLLGLALLLAGLVTMFFRLVPGLVCGIVAAALVVWGLVWQKSRKQEQEELALFYGSPNPERWREMAADYEARWKIHTLRTADICRKREMLELEQKRARQRLRELDRDSEGLTREAWERVLEAWDARDEALRTFHKAKTHYEDLKVMARQAKPPEFSDGLDYSQDHTDRLLAECLAERTRLENLQGQCRGSMEALGTRTALEKQLTEVKARIRKLEQTYGALTLAQEVLLEARQELQRRFAPRIAQRAGELMHRMTGGRYHRLNIGENLSIRAGAGQEDTLREALWRSDGTVDQLYLSLRLAVARELLPGGPLVLDDALVRFDDKRLKAAMDILREEAESKQVILFTCHSRENRF